MKTLLLTTSFPRSPGDWAGHFVASEAEALEQQGHSLVVLCPGPGTGHGYIPPSLQATRVLWLGGSSLFAEPGALPRLKKNPLRFLQLFSIAKHLTALRKTLESEDFDQVIAHWCVPSAFPWALSVTRSEVPLTVVLHGSDVRLLSRIPRPLSYFILHRLLRRRAQLRFVAHHLRQKLCEIHDQEPLASYLKSAEVRPAELCIGADYTKEEARERLGLTTSERVLLVVGRLIDSKRTAHALRAAALVPQAQVYVVGDGPLGARLRREFPEATFLGQLEHQSALVWIKAADVLLNASRTEGAPTTLREAMALSTSVVSVAVGDYTAASSTGDDLWIVS